MSLSKLNFKSFGQTVLEILALEVCRKKDRKKRIYSRARTIRGRELLEGEHYFKVGDPGARTIRERALIEGEHYSVY